MEGDSMTQIIYVEENGLSMCLPHDISEYGLPWIVVVGIRLGCDFWDRHDRLRRWTLVSVRFTICAPGKFQDFPTPSRLDSCRAGGLGSEWRRRRRTTTTRTSSGPCCQVE
ncbi:unnamed protein product, partial [Musa hybrid cultivar]